MDGHVLMRRLLVHVNDAIRALITNPAPIPATNYIFRSFANFRSHSEQ